MERLRKRRDFLMVQKGRRVHTGLFSVQCLAKADGAARIGFTVSKKVHLHAVKRNRIRRRLKEAVRQDAAAFSSLPADFVIVARLDTLTAPSARLRSELTAAITRAASMVLPITR
jgi:ribonuclease P protein component